MRKFNMFIVIFFTISFLFACGGGSGGSNGNQRIKSVKAIVNGGVAPSIKFSSKMDLNISKAAIPGSSADYTAKFNADGVLLEVTGPNSTKFIYTYPAENVMEKRYYESDVLKTVTVFHYNQPTFFGDGSLDESQKSDWVRVYNSEPIRNDAGVVISNATFKYKINYNRPNGSTWLVNAVQGFTEDDDHDDTDGFDTDDLSNEKKEFTYYSDDSVKTITYYDGSSPTFVATVQTFSTPIEIEEGTKIVEVVWNKVGRETYTVNEYVTANTVTEELLSSVEDGQPSTANTVTIDFDGADNVLGTADDGTVSGTDDTTLSPVETEYQYTYETGTDDSGNWFNTFKKELNLFE